MKPQDVRKLLESVKAHPNSKLSPKYVEQKLKQPGQHVIVYYRNDSIFSGDAGKQPSAFSIYQLSVENQDELVAKVDILSSLDSKARLKDLLKEQNVSEDEISIEGAGSTLLLDLKQFMIKFAKELKLEKCEIR